MLGNLYSWFGSGFIYARLNPNQYIGLGKKGARVKCRRAMPEMLNPFSF